MSEDVIKRAVAAADDLIDEVKRLRAQNAKLASDLIRRGEDLTRATEDRDFFRRRSDALAGELRRSLAYVALVRREDVIQRYGESVSAVLAAGHAVLGYDHNWTMPKESDLTAVEVLQ